MEPGKVSARAQGRTRTLRRVGIVATAVVLFAGAALTSVALKDSESAERAPAPDVTVPETRVRVQVLNATTTRGLARRATMMLRDRGFDVVEIGTASEQLDSSVVLDHSGHADRAQRVAAALGGARVEARPDTSRYLDVTVLVGRSWRPPAEPFYP